MDRVERFEPCTATSEARLTRGSRSTPWPARHSQRDMIVDAVRALFCIGPDVQRSANQIKEMTQRFPKACLPKGLIEKRGNQSVSSSQVRTETREAVRTVSDRERIHSPGESKLCDSLPAESACWGAVDLFHATVNDFPVLQTSTDQLSAQDDHQMTGAYPSSQQKTRLVCIFLTGQRGKKQKSQRSDGKADDGIDDEAA